MLPTFVQASVQADFETLLGLVQQFLFIVPDAERVRAECAGNRIARYGSAACRERVAFRVLLGNHDVQSCVWWDFQGADNIKAFLVAAIAAAQEKPQT